MLPLPLGLIPAKGFSERLPKKNLRLLAGRPLLEYTIEAAKASGLFGTNLWVSSESEDVLTLADDCGARTLRRPPSLALPAATVSHVILHTRQAIEWSGPIYVLLPSSPFRSSFTIQECWSKFSKSQAGALLSMRPVDHPPEWTFRFDPISGDVSAASPMVDAPRMALPKAWRHDGSHFIIGRADHAGGAIGFEVDAIESTDINTSDDLEYAEYLIRSGRVPWINAPKT